MVSGAPTNTVPARVINMSLGGFSPCPQALQDAINAALAQGAVITVAAGNEALDAATSAPARSPAPKATAAVVQAAACSWQEAPSL